MVTFAFQNLYTRAMSFGYSFCVVILLCYRFSTLYFSHVSNSPTQISYPCYGIGVYD